MNPNREELLFQLALTKPVDERAAWLDCECGEDKALRQRLEALLAAHEQSGGVLAESASGAKATLKIEFAGVPDEGVGEKIGRYKLLEKVGEGGCGVVYVAEQTEPVRRRVALKVIKLGMDTKAVVARFEAERQALAMMDHPNIAKVLDAGSTDQGRPFFVMELVRGIRITEYCDQNNLTTKDRLDLFIKVCQAIQHAHQKGIIHRDIKPSNILVTLHDGVPVPKVIDFGIAKATEGRLTDNTVYTQLHQFIGTPAYMSPEQAEMSGLDIDTRSDIYSLGVLLYEMLTGKTPFDAQELMSQGIDVMRKTIREKDPVRPSTKLATLEGEDRTTTAKRHAAEVSRLIHQLKGDLDWIVMKCLEKDRVRRYDTANGLAMDLKRHLNNEPVVARPSSATYKLQKAWRRNKLVFSAAIAIVISLGLGIVVSLWQATIATRARRAETTHRLEAESERRVALQNELVARQRLYAAEMSQAFDAWYAADMVRARTLLERQKPRLGERDLRGFEWRMLWQHCRPPQAASLEGVAPDGVKEVSSTDGRTVLVNSPSGGAWLYDATSGREVARIAGIGSMPSRDGRLVAVTTSNRTVRVWNVPERREVRTVRCRDDWLDDFADLQNDGTLAILTTNGFLKFWNAFSDTQDAVVSLGSEMSRDEGFTVEGRRVTIQKQAEIRFFDTEKMERPVTLADFLPNERLGGRAVSPDGAFLACGYRDNTARVWDTKSGKQVATLRGHTGRINDMQFSPDSNVLVTISDDATARIWSRAGWAAVETFRGHASAIYSLAFSPDSRFLATGGNDQAVKVWNLSERTDVATFRGHSADVRSLFFSSDGSKLISRSIDGAIWIWDSREFKDDSVLGQHSSWVRSVAFSREGVLASGSMDGAIKLWDLASRSESALLKEPDGVMVCNLALSPDGRTLASSHANGNVHLWRVENGALIETLPLRGVGAWIFKLAFSPDGRTLAFGGDNRLLLWDLHGHRIAANIPASNSVVVTAFSPDGKILAMGESLGTVSFWDVATTNLLWRGAHPSDLLMDLNFSGDGKLVATSGWDRLAMLWNLSTRAKPSPLTGHRGVVDTAVFSRDGNTLITASADSTIKLWRVDLQLEVGTLHGHSSPATTVAVSPDGTLFATAGGDRTIRLWKAPSWKEIDDAQSKEKTELKQP